MRVISKTYLLTSYLGGVEEGRRGWDVTITNLKTFDKINRNKKNKKEVHHCSVTVNSKQ